MCPYGVAFEVRRIDDEDYRVLPVLARVKLIFHRKRTAYTPKASACQACGLCVVSCPSTPSSSSHDLLSFLGSGPSMRAPNGRRLDQISRPSDASSAARSGRSWSRKNSSSCGADHVPEASRGPAAVMIWCTKRCANGVRGLFEA